MTGHWCYNACIFCNLEAIFVWINNWVVCFWVVIWSGIGCRLEWCRHMTKRPRSFSSIHLSLVCWHHATLAVRWAISSNRWICFIVCELYLKEMLMLFVHCWSHFICLRFYLIFTWIGFGILVACNSLVLWYLYHLLSFKLDNLLKLLTWWFYTGCWNPFYTPSKMCSCGHAGIW